MLMNGGTTYDHVVDDIAAFAGLHDQLVAEYRLSYRPHLHVDSVIGWGWLMLDDGVLSGPGLGLPEETVASLREQHRRISQVRLAGSWGVDFHKGIGGCPVDCSMVMFSDKADLGLLRKGAADEGSFHQLAAEFSSLSPVDYTLETARAGGKATAALTPPCTRWAGQATRRCWPVWSTRLGSCGTKWPGCPASRSSTGTP